MSPQRPDRRLSSSDTRLPLTAEWAQDRLESRRAFLDGLPRKVVIPKVVVMLVGGPLDGWWDECDLAPDQFELASGSVVGWYKPVLGAKPDEPHWYVWQANVGEVLTPTQA